MCWTNARSLRPGRNAEPEPAVAVVLGHVAAPFVEAERRIGNHPVIQQQLPLIYQLRVPDRVALLDPGVGQPVEQHVHLADGPGAEVLLLAVERQVARIAPVPLDVMGALDQHAARAGGRVADAHPFGRRQQLDDQLDDHPRRVELPALLARVVGELLDQVFVGAAEEVGLGHVIVAERDLREVLDQTREHGVAVPGVAELPLVVVVDAGEDAFQGAVLFLQGCARLVQRLADVRGPLLDGIPPRPVRHEELVLVRVGPRHLRGHALGNELLRLLLEPIGQPFQEEQAEDVGLVVAAVDGPAEDVRRGPERLFELRDAQLVRHGGGDRRRHRCASVSVLRCRGSTHEARGEIRLLPT